MTVVAEGRLVLDDTFAVATCRALQQASDVARVLHFCSALL
jgi:hypothetical protein